MRRGVLEERRVEALLGEVVVALDDDRVVALCEHRSVPDRLHRPPPWSWSRYTVACSARSSREAPALGAIAVEVLRREPGLERAPQRRPLVVDDREPGGVTVPPLRHLVLAEHALEAEAETLRRAPRRGVERVALPLEPPVSEVVERMPGQEIDRLGRSDRTAQRRAEVDVADLDHPVRRCDPQVREEPGGLDRRSRRRGTAGPRRPPSPRAWREARSGPRTARRAGRSSRRDRRPARASRDGSDRRPATGRAAAGGRARRAAARGRAGRSPPSQRARRAAAPVDP